MNEAKSKRQLCLNGEWVEYELVRKNIKNLYLRVSAEGILKISAPKRLSLSEIERFMAHGWSLMRPSLPSARSVRKSSSFLSAAKAVPCAASFCKNGSPKSWILP